MGRAVREKPRVASASPPVPEGRHARDPLCAGYAMVASRHQEHERTAAQTDRAQALPMQNARADQHANEAGQENTCRVPAHDEGRRSLMAVNRIHPGGSRAS
jgi:hypothetical protein